MGIVFGGEIQHFQRRELARARCRIPDPGIRRAARHISLDHPTAAPIGRWHDNRHTLVTELSESGAGDEVIMSIAGHVSRALLSRYSHVRMEAKRRALDEIAARQLTADEKRKADSERQARSSGGHFLSPVVQ